MGLVDVGGGMGLVMGTHLDMIKQEMIRTGARIFSCIDAMGS